MWVPISISQPRPQAVEWQRESFNFLSVKRAEGGAVESASLGHTAKSHNPLCLRIISHKNRNTITWQGIMKLKQRGRERLLVRGEEKPGDGDGAWAPPPAHRPGGLPFASRLSPAAACRSWAAALRSLLTLAASHM